MVLFFSPTSSNICLCQLPAFLDFTCSKISEGNVKEYRKEGTHDYISNMETDLSDFIHICFCSADLLSGYFCLTLSVSQTFISSLYIHNYT